MLIHRPTKKVVLNLRNPDRVTTVIPTAKKFTFRGHELVAVPHKLDEVRVLRNLGIEAPSPIRYHYDWPGRFKPFHAQLETASFLTLNPKSFVLNDMGTGKTLSTLWAYDYLREQGLANKMLVISPLSTLERTWADEVFNHFPHLSVGVLYGTKERRLKVLADDYDIYLINHDGIKVIEKELTAREGMDVVVVDEVASFRNASTGRWKSLRKITTGKTYLWGLTGTPTPNGPTDAWAQCKLISPERVPAYMGRFRDMVMKQLGQYNWVARPNATEIVQEAMQPAIRFSRSDCVDLPPCLYQTREVELSSQQKKAFNEMLSKLKMDHDDGQVIAVNEAVKMSKLVQIACGVVYGRNGEEVVLDNDPRIEVVKEIVEGSGTKTIVFVPFKGVLRHVAEELSADYDVGMISGDTPKAERDKIFSAFQSGKHMKVLVAQPAAMSHGLTLTAASTVVWYAPVTSNEIYQQANARITRPGQKHNQLIVDIQATKVEQKIYQRLKTKQSLQGLLLEAVRGV